VSLTFCAGAIMSRDNIIALLLFTVAGAFTPGPNTIMVTASGNAFGFARSLPHIFGVTIGFALMLALFGFGLGRVFQTYPVVHESLRYLGAAYLLYLAWRLAQAGNLNAAETTRRPLSVVDGALFQWVNPKAVTLAIGVVASFTTVGGDLWTELAIIVAVFAVMTLVSLFVWCLFGMAIRRFLSSPRALRITSLSMAGLLAASVVLLFV
jgi:threonine/homoserine/homoserine lactone efflux protein